MPAGIDWHQLVEPLPADRVEHRIVEPARHEVDLAPSANELRSQLDVRAPAGLVEGREFSEYAPEAKLVEHQVEHGATPRGADPATPVGDVEYGRARPQ